MIFDEARTKLSRTLWGVTAAALFALALVGPLNAQEQTAPSDWREMNAYTLGVQAYLYAFPWSYMTEARWTRSAPVGHQANHLYHVRDLANASHLDGGALNNDTLYSRSWVYLKD